MEWIYQSLSRMLRSIFSRSFVCKVLLVRVPSYFCFSFFFVCIFSNQISSSLSFAYIIPLNNVHYFQLWPENPGYQVYIPGYNANPGHSSLSIHQQHPVYGQVSSLRARSVTPTESNPNGPGLPPNRMLYADLQFPSTANYGSMKKKSSHRDRHSATSSTNNTSSTSAGEASPSSDASQGAAAGHHISQSLDNVNRGYSEYVNRKTAV